MTVLVIVMTVTLRTLAIVVIVPIFNLQSIQPMIVGYYQFMNVSSY